MKMNHLVDEFWGIRDDRSKRLQIMFFHVMLKCFPCHFAAHSHGSTPYCGQEFEKPEDKIALLREELMTRRFSLKKVGWHGQQQQEKPRRTTEISIPHGGLAPFIPLYPYPIHVGTSYFALFT